MKTLPAICTAVSLAAGTTLHAQKPAADPAPAKEKIELKADTTEDAVKLDDVKKTDTGPAAPAAEKASLPGLEKMTDEQKKILLAGMGEVSTFLRGVRWQEALEKLGEMEAAIGENHYIENLRGAVFTRMTNFEKARGHFKKSLELAKGDPVAGFHPRFNLAEIDFVLAGHATRKHFETPPAPGSDISTLTKMWDTARDAFQKLLKDAGKPSTGSDSLINFKLLICDLQQMKLNAEQAKVETNAAKKTEYETAAKKMEAHAGVIKAAFDQYDDLSPAYYFGHAVELFAKNDKDGAAEWLESARKIYPKETNEVYNDSLVEMGWLETLQ